MGSDRSDPEPQVANGPVMIVVAVAAIIVNLVISLLLHSALKQIDKTNVKQLSLAWVAPGFTEGSGATGRTGTGPADR